ncbi:lectin c-type domain-containing protein [Ditylenchus destructor]|uniref:Lectin c-type domain-containing protein n=1 Tax=Ditylenchus destructor TaxID=166010 RepID=A0AAD4NHM0_9BILA|nr:lectin c-type domain-containing protein [Ditylenchus destructor]
MMVSNRPFSLVLVYVLTICIGTEVSAKPPEYDEEGLLKCPWDICQVDGSFPPYCNKGEVCKPCWHFTFFGACVDENASVVTRTTDNYLTNEPGTSMLPLNRTDAPATRTHPPSTHTDAPTTYTSPASFEPQIPCDPGNSKTCPEGYVCSKQSENNKCVPVETSITSVTQRTGSPSPSTSPKPHHPKPYPINCPDNFAEVGKYNRCLLYQEDPKTLTNAHRKCLADGGALASASPEMPGFDKIKEIALNKSNGSPVSIWHEYVDGKQRWKPHCIAFPEGKCDPEKQTELPYFCEYYKTVSNPNGMSFAEARKACQALGGGADVAVVNSMGKNELLRRLLEQENLMDPDYQHHDPLDNAWIGLFHDGKKLQWVDGEEEKILLEEENKGKYPWAPGEPGLDSSEKCTEVKTGEQGLWNDLFCSQPLRAAICSRKFSLQP